MTDVKRLFLHFTTSYYTRWGQNLVISGPDSQLGGFDLQR